MSKRKSIRTAVSAALKGKTQADQNVFTSRYSALFSDAYPLILIYTPEEELETYVNSPRQYQRTMTLIVSAIIKANDDVDDEIDDLAEDLEAAIAVDQTFGGLAMGSVLKKIDSEVDTEGESQLAAVHLTLEVEYFE